MWADVIQIGVVMAAGDAADDRHLPAGRADRGHARPRHRAHRRLHGARVRQLVQLLQSRARKPRVRSRTCSSTRGFGARSHCRSLLQVAVVNLGFLNLAFGTVPLDARPVAAVRGDGQRGAVVQRAAQAGESRTGFSMQLGSGAASTLPCCSPSRARSRSRMNVVSIYERRLTTVTSLPSRDCSSKPRCSARSSMSWFAAMMLP